MNYRKCAPVIALFLAFTTSWVHPQTVQKDEEERIQPVPVVTGYAGFITTSKSGKQTVVPILTPVLLVPVGENWLIEAEFEVEGEFEREDGSWEKGFEKELEYLQVDYFAHRYLTVVAGRFLTPFGIFNERLHPIWIKNLQPTPLILPIEAGSANGMMLRGAAQVFPGVNLSYTGYYSALTQTKTIESKRMAGARWSLFLPGKQFEMGASFQRLLQEDRFNSVGIDATWQMPRRPLDFRMEYARSDEGSGYWVEGAYRLRQVGFWKPFFRRSQVVFRVEQFFAPSHLEEMEHDDDALIGEDHNDRAFGMVRHDLEDPLEEGHDEVGGHEEEGQGEEEGGHHGRLPEVDTQRLMVGWNYYFSDGLKLTFSYGRNLSVDTNLWSLGLTYRFLF